MSDFKVGDELTEEERIFCLNNKYVPMVKISREEFKKMYPPALEEIAEGVMKMQQIIIHMMPEFFIDNAKVEKYE